MYNTRGSTPELEVSRRLGAIELQLQLKLLCNEGIFCVIQYSTQEHNILVNNCPY